MKKYHMLYDVAVDVVIDIVAVVVFPQLWTLNHSMGIGSSMHFNSCKKNPCTVINNVLKINQKKKKNNGNVSNLSKYF